LEHFGQFSETLLVTLARTQEAWPKQMRWQHPFCFDRVIFLTRVSERLLKGQGDQIGRILAYWVII
jgi:hypothetical protein